MERKNMKKESLFYKPGAPFSKAVKANGFLFVSGNVAVDTQTGARGQGDIKDQTRLVLQNLKKIVEDAGSTFEDVVRVNVYLTDIKDFSGMNEVYKQFFPDSPPTRTTVGVKELSSPEFIVEIDLIAAL
jgi:2-iminobutanoate/2-iminopropanoate deaminase